jgi:predicted RNase H-like nuclease
MSVAIVGIDCATDPNKTGLALASVDGNKTVLQEVTTGRDRSPAEIVNRWIQGSRQALLALDAPLGWPAGLGRALAVHMAGWELQVSPTDLFKRTTDKFVTETLGKRPLDVGADRIARTAHSALAFLSALRRLSGSEIPLAWSPRLGQKIEAIEVYPAGTLTALGLPSVGYKKPKDRKVREKILNGISLRVDAESGLKKALVGNADLLDAVICTLAARDFLDWKVMPPRDMDVSQKEGWIWVRAPQSDIGPKDPRLKGSLGE